MNKLKVFFRADGGLQIGMGHLVRCIALAQMLKDDFDIYFACKYIPANCIIELDELGFNLINIKEERDFLEILSNDVIVVLDHYDLDSNYQSNIKDKGCKLVCIDDLHDKVFFADLIINHAPGVSKESYDAQPYTQFALGPNYALLRPVFLDPVIINKSTATKIATILICFGGSDSKNLTKKVLDIVLAYPRFTKIILITGSAYSNLASIEPIIEKSKNIFHYHNVDAEEMLKLFIEAQLIVVPSSGILLEALVSQALIISGFSADNQKIMYASFAKSGYIIPANDFDEKYLKSILNKIDDFKVRNEKVIDSKIKHRIIEKFKHLKYGK